ncbi:TolC family protein, partial [Klebsiella variicola]|nr:TolC family protein [Klebsiella variicola]
MKAMTRARFSRIACVRRTPVRPLALALTCALLTACAAVGPDYREPPPVDVGNGWTVPLASESAAALAHWWSTLDDPVLDRLIATAL